MLLAVPVTTMAEVKVTLLTENGGRVDWSHAGNNLIAFDRQGKDGYFDVWTMQPQGGDQRCLTCNATALPQRHIGNPVWHPSGQWIIFQAQKAHVPRLLDNVCTPGAGTLNDLWAMTPDGKHFWKLYSVSDGVSRNAQGLLHAHFTHDGSKLIWSERVKANGQAFGEWVMRKADFIVSADGPSIQNVQTINPSRASAFYETHSFSPDDRYFLFTGNHDSGLEIYEYDLKTTQVRRLTHDPFIWDEHAHYSNDGRKIVWISNRGFQSEKRLKAELWIMDRGGLNKRQLTYFNTPGHAHYLNRPVIVAADSSFSPVGNQLVLTLIDTDPEGPDRDKGLVVLVTLE